MAIALLALPVTARTEAAALPPHSCGWATRIGSDQLNVAFPDASAEYWVADVPIPPGGHLELSGSFPHSRYTSFIDYTPATQAIDGLADAQISPDPGSTNPFLPGADRTATQRSYSVRVVDGPAPASGRAQNTIYTASADGSKQSAPGTALMIYRVYEPDRGLDLTGGVNLPAITMVSADGQRTALPNCPDDSLPVGGLTQGLAGAGPSGSSPLPNTGLGSRNPPAWVKFTNPVNGVATGALDNQDTGDSVYPPVASATNRLPPGGFFENIHNAYVFTFYSAGFGPVVSFRAKAPTTPQTFAEEPTMGTGQLRFWSLCTNNGLTMAYGCARDDQVPVDSQGFYTLVVSTAANRPRNATPECGIAWLPAGPTPQSVLILRNMLPAADFANAIQNATQGTEQQTMGPYYPVGRYYAQVKDFERTGCRPNR